MKKVIFFGSIPLATRCLKAIIASPRVHLLGVCCVPLDRSGREDDECTVFDFCRSQNIPVVAHNDLLNMEPDLGISVRYHRILEESIIDLFKEGIVNTHGGILPEYRGTYSNINAILNGDTEFGVTLHYIDSGIDDGDIIDVLRVPIGDSETGFGLYVKGETLCYEILIKNLDSILDGNNRRISQSSLIERGARPMTYKKRDTLEKRFIPLDKLGDEYSLRIIRAFDSPFHEPAYTKIGDQVIHLRIRTDNDC